MSANGPRIADVICNPTVRAKLPGLQTQPFNCIELRVRCAPNHGHTDSGDTRSRCIDSFDTYQPQARSSYERSSSPFNFVGN